jgi:hypothetical protein
LSYQCYFKVLNLEGLMNSMGGMFGGGNKKKKKGKKERSGGLKDDSPDEGGDGMIGPYGLRLNLKLISLILAVSISKIRLCV